MTQTGTARRRRLVGTAGALAALGVVAVASLAIATSASRAGGGESDPTACADAAAPATEAAVKDLRGAVRCLINEERAAHGFDKLARDVSLQRASQRHAKAMVAADCLAHRCADEDSLEDRLAAAGYFDGAESWRYAENTGCGESAEAMVANWMTSVYHRVNILDPEFAEVGIGVSPEKVSGRCKKDYGTFAVVFAERKLASSTD